jgi:hypothetical protein
MTMKSTDAVASEESKESARAVHVPERLLERIETRLPRTSFETADEYVAFVLGEVLSRVEDASDGDEYESVDEREVESRLKSLGYLD